MTITLATVIAFPVVEEPRELAYRSHDTKPAGGLPLVEWAIEQQLAEGLPADAFGLMVDAELAGPIERLYDLADEVVRQELNGTTAAWRAAYEDYGDHLYALARMVRGGAR